MRALLPLTLLLLATPATAAKRKKADDSPPAKAMADTGSPTQQAMLGLMGVGAQYGVILPYSRTHETEADSIGLDLMARAGFHPNESVELWINMAEAGGGQPPELLSTHPSHESRILNLEKRLPEAEKLRAEAYAAGRRPRCGP